MREMVKGAKTLSTVKTTAVQLPFNCREDLDGLIQKGQRPGSTGFTSTDCSVHVAWGEVCHLRRLRLHVLDE